VTKIQDIRPGMRNIEITGMITEKGERKEVSTRFGPALVSWAILKDETGSIRLNLWRWQVDAVQTGDLVRIVNAFVRVFGESMELNVGGDGKIMVMLRRDGRFME